MPRRPRLSPEYAALLALARSDPSPAHFDVVREAAGRRLDWDDLWLLSCRHGVGWLVAQHLLPDSRDPNAALPVPGALGRRVREDLWYAAARALLLLDQEVRVTAEFERRGLGAVWLKGLALAQRLYGHVEARQCSDLDVLVEPAGQPDAEEGLRRLGYQRLRSDVPGLDCHVAGSQHSVWLAEAAAGCPVALELHNRPSGDPQGCQPATEALIRRARVVPLRGRSVRIPSPEDELLLLCLHAHQHNFGLLRCLTDVAEFVKKYQEQLDWRRLLAEAQLCRAETRLSAALWIADASVGLGRGAAVLPRLPPLAGLKKWVVRGLLRGEGELGEHAQQDHLRGVGTALLMDRPGDAARVLWPRVVPPGPYVRAVFPSWKGRLPGAARLRYLARGAWKLVRAAAAASPGGEHVRAGR
jgi:hypothetical protein